VEQPDTVFDLVLFKRRLVDTVFGAAPRRVYIQLDKLPLPQDTEQVKKWVYKQAIAQVMSADRAEREDAFSDNQGTTRAPAALVAK
jgi:hypothetical protein